MSIRRSAVDDSDAFAHVLSCVEDFAWYMPGLRRGLPTHNCGAAGEATTVAFKTATQLCHRVDCGSRLRRRWIAGRSSPAVLLAALRPQSHLMGCLATVSWRLFECRKLIPCRFF